MASDRKFFRTVLEVEVLSEDPYDPTSKELEDVATDITTGDCSGDVQVKVANEVLDGPAAAEALRKQGSDPGFFQLTDEGDDTYGDDEQD